jgi:beta-lactam-binding protein with PASTA domain/tRNA A-37 threonylcarbamoyl transferase component Bud32
MTDQQSERLFGDRYQLVRHIARGGMAQVYLARDLLLDRPVALKVLFPELSVDPSFVERFRREAQAAANLSHPNIVSIYDWGEDDHTYFIVMEFVDGETLSARIRRGPLAADQAAIVAIATASALAFAHRRQVIHRDVKPGNVLIDRSGQVKVADFGIARAVGTSEDLTQAGAVMGTATYFSPEQAQGQAVDARSDVYSLGVVLYEMVVGRPPFQGDNPVAIAYKHVREAPPSPRAANPAVPEAFESIVLKALAKDRDDRYQTADELRADLERFRAGRPVLAAGPGGIDPGATTVIAAGALAAAGVAATTRVNPVADRTAVAPVVAAGAGVVGAEALGPGGPVRRPPEPVEEDRSRTGLYAALLVGLLVLLGLLAFFLGRDLGLFGSAKTLTMPSVANTPEAAALARLHQTGFTSVTTVTTPDATVAKGNAIGTRPPSGSRVKSDASVTLEVSGGSATTAVPSVDGQSQAAATRALEKAGFKVSPSTQPSATVGKGDAIRTDPPGGSPAARGITVQLVVSSGPAEVTIPPLTGSTQVSAAAALARLLLNVGPSQTEPSSSVTAGDVTRTVPAAGNQVPAGTPVTIYVSSGPAQVAVPNVINDTQSQAQAALAAAGLNPSFQTVPVTSRSQDGKVQSTSPPANAMVSPGSTVVVDVGSYTAPTTTTTAPPAPSSTTATSATSTTTTTLPTSKSAAPPGPPVGGPATGADPGRNGA